MYVYIKSESGLWTVGFFNPETSDWVSESDHDNSQAAARRVSFLNGGQRFVPEARARVGQTCYYVCPNCGEAVLCAPR